MCAVRTREPGGHGGGPSRTSKNQSPTRSKPSGTQANASPATCRGAPRCVVQATPETHVLLQACSPQCVLQSCRPNPETQESQGPLLHTPPNVPQTEVTLTLTTPPTVGPPHSPGGTPTARWAQPHTQLGRPRPCQCRSTRGSCSRRGAPVRTLTGPTGACAGAAQGAPK